MSTVNEPIRFGDVVKLQTTSAFVDSATPSNLSFLELTGKTQTQLLVVPPVKDEVKDRLVEAEFIIAPIRGEKQQPNGTPLTYQTPFVLRTSDGKDGSTYSLNNKVAGQREGISLQIAATKGEMYIQVEKEGSTKATSLHYGTGGLNLRVVDSNRVRKTQNQLLTHTFKPKSDTVGGMITCGAKGTPLTFSFQRAVDAEGNPLTETRKYINNPQARRTSMDAISPGKMDQLGRAERIDSSEFSDVDAMSRSSSVAGLNSNPASPRGAPGANGFATPVSAAAVAARFPAQTVEGSEKGSSSSVSSGSSANNSSAETKTPAASAATPTKNAVVDAKSSIPTPSPPVKTASVKVEIAKIEAAKAEAAKASPVKAEAAKAGVVKADPTKATPGQPEAKTLTPPLAPAATAATMASKATPAEPKTVIADASTFPPMPLINGPAPAPVVVSPKAPTSTKPTVKAGATPTATKATPASHKMLKEEEVARLKAEAEVENLEPACAAKCSVM